MTELLTASELWFSYTDVPVVRVAALSLRAGEVVALLGQTAPQEHAHSRAARP